MSASARGRLIWKLADLIERNIDEIAELETLDNGKPIFESRQVDMPMRPLAKGVAAGSCSVTHYGL